MLWPAMSPAVQGRVRYKSNEINKCLNMKQSNTLIAITTNCDKNISSFLHLHNQPVFPIQPPLLHSYKYFTHRTTSTHCREAAPKLLGLYFAHRFPKIV